jgi:hypothetical protein
MQAQSSLSHHGRSQVKTGAQKKEHPLKSENCHPAFSLRDEKIRRHQEQLRRFDKWLLAHPMLSTLIAVLGALLILGLACLLKKLLGGN